MQTPWPMCRPSGLEGPKQNERKPSPHRGSAFLGIFAVENHLMIPLSSGMSGQRLRIRRSTSSAVDPGVVL